MPVKIRLQRHGKKGKPFYWVVAADARAKRDGRFLEKIGTYNPNTNPATIDLNVDSAVKWLENGAQPTDTARALLSYRGALLKKHLNVGVRKGALTQEEADKKLEAWLEEKQSRIQAKVDSISKDKATSKAKALAAETAVKEKRLTAHEEAAQEAEKEAPPASEEANDATTVAADETAEATTETAASEAEEASPETTTEEAPEAVAKAGETTPPPAEETPEAKEEDSTATPQDEDKATEETKDEGEAAAKES